MGRPSRSWVHKTYTVSPEVETAIAVHAAEQGIDQGTLIDILVWKALVKPSEDQLKRSNPSPGALNRLFAEEVLPFLDGELQVVNLSRSLLVDGDERVNLQKVRSLVRRWRRTRHIDRIHWRAVLSCLSDQGATPVLVHLGFLDLETLPTDKPPSEPQPSRQEELERSFASEALPLLESEEAIDALAEELILVDGDETANLRAVERLVKQWKKAHIIDKTHQRTLLVVLGNDWVPTILRKGQVDLGWFDHE